LAQHLLDVGGKIVNTVKPENAGGFHKHYEQDGNTRPVNVQKSDQINATLRKKVKMLEGDCQVG
jgi:hypothetical protein